MTAEQQGSDEGGEGLTEAEREDLRMAAVRAGYRGDEEIYQVVQRILTTARRDADEMRARLGAVESLADDLCDFHGGHGDFLTAGKSLRAALASPPAVQHEAEVGARALREAAEFCEATIATALGAIQNDFADGWRDASKQILDELRDRADREATS